MICTFYSYKGGVGRSMAMANVADILARRGLKVLMVDFDLEAPGLEQFFRINHDGVRRNPGLLDLLLDYKHAMSTGGRGEARFREVSRYIVPVYPSLSGGGKLDLLPAGQRHDPEHLARYALNLRTFDWQDFYYNWQGERFFEWLRRSHTRERYDLVLVDSRTGVTEMGGICGYQLADTIIMLCAANHQNVDGTVSMLRDFRSPAVEALRRDRALDIVVVPARIEQGDPSLLEDFFARFEAAFSTLVPPVLATHGLRFRDLTIPYEPLYAFEEQVTSDPRHVGHRQHIGNAFERLADAVAALLAPDFYRGPHAGARPPQVSAPAPAQFDTAKRFADFDVFLASTDPGRSLVPDLAASLSERGLRTFTHRPGSGSEWQAVLEDSLFHSHLMVLALGSDGLTAYGEALLELARRTTARGKALPVVPVLLPGAQVASLADAGMQRFQAVDLREGADAAGLERLHQAVRACLAPAPQVEASARTPYTGTESWDERDSDLFFGRDALIEQVLDTLRDARVVSVTGPSGTGKTSLIQAGVVPRLRGRDGDAAWTILSCTCRLREVDGIDAVLYHHLGLADDMTLPDLSTLIRDSARKVPGSNLLLVVDQVEDILDIKDWESSARMLGAALDDARKVEGFHAVLITRSDALPRLSRVESLGSLLHTNPVQVGSMNAQQLRRAIEGPVDRVGAAFEPGLVGRILKEMEGEPDALPLLQGLLQALWVKRRNGWLTNEAFDEMGGIGGVVVERAESVFGKLDEDQREAFRRIMLGLVRTVGGEHGRRRQPLSALLPSGMHEGDAASDTYRALAERLVDEHLLIARATDSGRRAVEPSHDALIRDWPRLRGWLDEDRQFLQWRDRLADAANAWDQAGRPRNLLLRGAELAMARDWHEGRASDLTELQSNFITGSTRRRNRKMVIFIGLLSAIAVLTTGTAIFALKQRVEAVRQQQEAKLAQDNAELLRKTAESGYQKEETRGKQLQGEVETLKAQVEEMGRYTAELEDRAGRLEQNEQQRSEWEAKAVAAQKTADRLRASLKSLHTNVEQQAPRVSSRLVVHYSSKSQYPSVVRLAKSLQREGIEVPSPELTEAVKRSQLRYFSKDAETVKEARRLGALLRKRGVRDLVERLVRSRKAVREGHFELWLSPSFAARAK